MSKGRPVSKISLSQEEFEKLRLIERRPKSEQSVALRASIILSCAQDKSNQAVAQELGFVCTKLASGVDVLSLKGWLD